MDTLTPLIGQLLTFVIAIALLWFGLLFIVRGTLGTKAGSLVEKTGRTLGKGALRLTGRGLKACWRAIIR